MITKFLDSPRWPGGPRICIVANLPAFETEGEARHFNVSNGPEHPALILSMWQCSSCNGFHYWAASAPDRSGACTVPERVAKLVLGWGARASA